MSRSFRLARVLLLVALPLVVSLGARPAAAEEPAPNAGWYVAAGAASLIYTPLKVTNAVLGSAIGSVAWFALGGDDDAAEAIILPAVRGDYFVKPSHLRGERHLRFADHYRF